MHRNCAPLDPYKMAKLQCMVHINNSHSIPSFTRSHNTTMSKSSVTSSPSTSSLQLTTSSASSTIPLRSSVARKDYSAAFGALQSTYGMGAGQLSSSMPTPKTKPSKPFQLGSLFRHSARPLPTVPDSHSTENTTARPSKSPKDYEAAFGALSSSRGLGQPSLSSGNWLRDRNGMEAR
ncbi:hypothetical protein PTI98_011925 [Pleurotus ostreatus]|nr:hypothetical protein PTI98_011925 [Pleurotus ostreatus]